MVSFSFFALHGIAKTKAIKIVDGEELVKSILDLARHGTSLQELRWEWEWVGALKSVSVFIRACLLICHNASTLTVFSCVFFCLFWKRVPPLGQREAIKATGTVGTRVPCHDKS